MSLPHTTAPTTTLTRAVPRHPERVLRKRHLGEDVLAAVTAAAPSPVSWTLAAGVLAATTPARRVWITAIDRWDGDYLRYTGCTADGFVVLLDHPTDFDEASVIARDVRAGLALLADPAAARP